MELHERRESRTKHRRVINKDVGIRVRTLRNNIGLTREKMAEVLDISPTLVSHIELGRRSVSISNAIKLCNLFNTSLDYLFCGITQAPMHISEKDSGNLAALAATVLNETEQTHLIQLVTEYASVTRTKNEVEIIMDTLRKQVTGFNRIKVSK